MHSRLIRHLCRLPALLAELLIRGYQVMLAPLLVGHCKFIPSCSDYMIQAVREWGVCRGGWLGIKRIIRCRPRTLGGLDPVPERKSGKNEELPQH